MSKINILFCVFVFVIGCDQSNKNIDKVAANNNAISNTMNRSSTHWQEKSNDEWDYLNLALRAEKEGNYESAIMYYQKIIKLDTKASAQAHFHVGLIYLEQFNEPEKASYEFEKALLIDEKNFESHRELYHIYKNAKEFEKAKYHLILYMKNWDGEEYFLKEMQKELDDLEKNITNQDQ